MSVILPLFVFVVKLEGNRCGWIVDNSLASEWPFEERRLHAQLRVEELTLVEELAIAFRVAGARGELAARDSAFSFETRLRPVLSDEEVDFSEAGGEGGGVLVAHAIIIANQAFHATPSGDILGNISHIS
jgi:hypothetical protein